MVLHKGSDWWQSESIVAWEVDGKALLAWSDAKLVRLAPDGASFEMVPGEWTIGSLSMAEDGAHLLHRSDLYTYPALEEVEVRSPWVTTAVAIHPHKPWIALSELDGGLRVFDGSTGETLWRNADDVHSLSWSPSGDRLAVSAGEAGLRIYDSAGLLLKERKIGAVGAPIDVGELFCGDGEVRMNGRSMFSRSIVGPIQWSPNGRALLFGHNKWESEPDKNVWILWVPGRDALHKIRWGRTVFGPGDLELLTNAPNGEHARLMLVGGKCELTDVGEVNPLATPISNGRTATLVLEGLSVDGGTPLSVHGHRTGFLLTAQGSIVAAPGDVPTLVDLDSGAWIQLQADDTGIAAVDSTGRFWVQDGSEHLIAAWTGEDVRTATRWTPDQVRASSDATVWDLLP